MITNSQASRDATIDFVGGLKTPAISVVLNGVDPVPLVSDEEPVQSDHPFTVGFIGRDDPAKGLDVLLTALGRLDPARFAASLVGRGVPTAVAGWSKALPVTVTHDRVPDPWTAIGPIDVLVVPSRSEGLPNVVSEAFIRRVPVVACDAGGTRELVTPDRGTLVNVEDAVGLASAIEDVSRRPDEAQRRAEHAYRFAITHQTWQRVVADWDRYLVSVVSETR